MATKTQIKEYLSSLPEAKKADLTALHQRMLSLFPAAKLWYTDGKDETGKIVANPGIGYGSYEIKYADGSRKEFYQVGLSSNTAGISVYIMGLQDKNYLPASYTKSIGKATVTGYCIKFRKLVDVNLQVLETAVKDVFVQTSHGKA